MDNLLTKLGGWVKVIQAALIGTIIIETILVIIIGIASNKIDNGANCWLWILIFCVAVYTFLIVIKALYQLKFPGSIVEELQAKRQLEVKDKLFERQRAINGFIKTTIKGLNKQTCSITGADDIEHLCDQELGISLTQLLEPIISYTDVILDTSTVKKFTIGIHLDVYHKLPDDYNSIELVNDGDQTWIKDYNLISDCGIIILRDELNLTDLLPKQLLTTKNVNGPKYEIQTAIKRTLNNLTFTSHDFTDNNDGYTIICSEILEVCSDDYSNGVLFIIFKKGVSFPEDVPDILGIFNRMTANYVSKYNACISDEVVRHKLKEAVENSQTK